MPEVRLLVLAAPYRAGETLVVGRHRRHVHFLPRAGLDVLAQANAQLAPVVPVLHLDAAAFAIDAEPQLVEVTGRPTRRVDHAKRAVREVDGHREAVVGIELVLADLVARGLVEGLEP